MNIRVVQLSLPSPDLLCLEKIFVLTSSVGDEIMSAFDMSENYESLRLRSLKIQYVCNRLWEPGPLRWKNGAPNGKKSRAQKNKTASEVMTESVVVFQSYGRMEYLSRASKNALQGV